VAILAIPILDTMAAIFRRKLTGRSIFTTDREHIHHCLLRHGFSKIKVLMLVSLFCMLSVVGAYLGISLNNEWLALLAAVTVVFILIGMRWFGHGETMLVADRLKNLARSVLKLPGSGSNDSAILLQGKGAWTDPWTRLIQSAEELGLKSMRLDVNAPALHESYNARWVDPCEEDLEVGETCWTAALPLVWQDQTVGRLEVSGRRDGQPIWKKIAELTKLVDELEFVLFKIADDAGLNVRPAERAVPVPVPSFDVPLVK
jgi:UDP-GlcNAc:undecaprenyl-phosphate GlcNAc-1-phosphate transferase